MASEIEENAARESEHAAAVREMFSGIAGRYDFLNHILSLNIDRRWRRRVSSLLTRELADRDALVLDVACGTGDLAIELRRHGPATIIATDFCRPMLTVAEGKNEKLDKRIPYVESDGLSLSFADGTFDAVTIAFGLRNFSNWKSGLEELRRVLKIGGRLVVLEFSAPILPGFKQLFSFYFKRVLPRIGGAVSGSHGAYQYLPDSVAKFPDQEELVGMMGQIGFSNVKYSNLTGGIAAIHTGTKN